MYGRERMLQCAGCGEEVSEYAARCPNCHHGTEDATDVEPPVLEAVEPPRFAPLIPTPTRQPPRRRFVAMAFAAVVAIFFIVGAVTGGWSLSSGRSSVPAALRLLSGRVLALSSKGGIVSVTPATGKVQRFPVPARASSFPPIAVSSDGKLLLDAEGKVVVVTTGYQSSEENPPSAALSRDTVPAPSAPFGDHDQTVLLLTRRTVRAPASSAILNLADGDLSDIGVIDSGGADPETTGAFVSVPARANQSDLAYPAGPDVRLELRIPGQPAVTVATAAQLNEEVGSYPATPILLSVYPDPTGNVLAVTLDPLHPMQGNVPLLLLTRTGNPITAFAGGVGPTYESQPVWSPDGRQLAYPTHTPTGTSLDIVTLSGTTRELPALTPSSTFGRCVWSPDSADVVCQTQIPAPTYQWQYATPTTSRLLSVRSSGTPLAWIGTSEGLASPGECRTLSADLCKPTTRAGYIRPSAR